MKFDRYNNTSDFTEVMTSRERAIFNRAFSTKQAFRVETRQTNGKTETIKIPYTVIHHYDRQWVYNVLEIFADKMHVPFSVAVHAFKTGSSHSLKDHLARKAEKFRIEYHSWPQDKRRDWDARNPEGFPPQGLAKMQFHDFRGVVRNRWAWALTLRYNNQIV